MELESQLYGRCSLSIREAPSDRAFCIYAFDSETVAKLTALPSLEAIKADAAKLGHHTICIYVLGEPEPYRIRVKKFMTQSNQPQIITPAFFAAAGWISPTLWARLGKLLEQPDIKKGVTRASDKRQLYVTQAAAQAVKHNAEAAANRVATDYLDPADMTESDNTINQQATQSEGVITTYRATLGGTSIYDPDAQWGLFSAKTFVFEDELGVFYRESEILDIKELAERPAILVPA